MQLLESDAAFLVDCLEQVAVGAPCRERIENVVASVSAGEEPGSCCIPDSIFVRSLAIGSVLWAIDNGVVEPAEQDQAQRVLDTAWKDGPIRPELIAGQLRCLVGQPADAMHCLWTCPAMAHANAGYNPQLTAEMRSVLPGLIGTVIAEGVDTLALVHTDPGQNFGTQVRAPRYGARIACQECGSEGTVLGTDADDGWTVVEHHPRVIQRPDGMWQVSPDESPLPRQCRYLARRRERIPA